MALDFDGLDIDDFIISTPVLPSFKEKAEEIFENKKKYTKIIKEDGIYYYYNGKIHREGDNPAVILNNGTKKYYFHDRLHRDNDKPAIVSEEKEVYYFHGLKHREGDKPAELISSSTGSTLIFYEYDDLIKKLENNITNFKSLKKYLKLQNF